MDNEKEKPLTGSKLQKFVLPLFGTYGYTTVASDIKSSRLVFSFSLVGKLTYLDKTRLLQR